MRLFRIVVIVGCQHQDGPSHDWSHAFPMVAGAGPGALAKTWCNLEALCLGKTSIPVTSGLVKKGIPGSWMMRIPNLLGSISPDHHL